MNLSDNEWETLAEIEGVLNITALATTLAQSERQFVGAYRVFVKQLVLDELRNPSINVYQWSPGNSIGKDREVKRVPKPVMDWTAIGRIARTRAILEGERRWTGNKTEEVCNSNVTWIERDRLAAFLDFRTINAMPREELRAAVETIKQKFTDMCIEDQPKVHNPYY